MPAYDLTNAFSPPVFEPEEMRYNTNHKTRYRLV